MIGSVLMVAGIVAANYSRTGPGSRRHAVYGAVAGIEVAGVALASS